jgi:hypothetical protein
MASFPLNGIQRSKPLQSGAENKNASQNGDCEEVINLRYKNGAWRPVGKISTEFPNMPFGLTSGESITALYVHTISTSEEVFVAATSKGYLRYWQREWTSIKVVEGIGAGKIEIDSLGNVLIVNNTSTNNISWLQYSTKGYVYEDAIQKLPTLTAQYKADTDSFGYGASGSVAIEKNGLTLEEASQRMQQDFSSQMVADSENQMQMYGKFNGVVLLQCALELKDGSIVGHTPLTAMANMPITDIHTGYSLNFKLMYSKISCKLSLTGRKDIVRRVIIYSSRVISLIDLDRPLIVTGETEIHVLISNRYRVNESLRTFSFIDTEPLYELYSINIENGEIIPTNWISLNYRGMSQKAMTFSPTRHGMSSNNVMVGNSRVMLIGVKTSVDDGYTWAEIAGNPNAVGPDPVVMAEYDGEEYYVSRGGGSWTASNQEILSGLILSYPSLEGKVMYYGRKSSNGVTVKRSVFLKAHPTLNIAYSTAVNIPQPPQNVDDEIAISNQFFSRHGNNFMYPPETFNDIVILTYGIFHKMMYFSFDLADAPGSTIASVPSVSKKLSENNNKLRITEAFQPFSYPPQLSYTLDGDIIGVAMNSIPLSTGQFGAFPLLIATTTGWKAAQIGTGDVYIESISPLNDLVPISNRHIVNADSNIIFAAVDGVYLLRGAEAVKISEPLEDRNAPEQVFELGNTISHGQLSYLPAGVISNVPFLTYLTGASMAYNNTENELIITNPSYAYSYIYSVEGNLWHKVSETYSLMAVSYPRLYSLRQTYLNLAWSGVWKSANSYGEGSTVFHGGKLYFAATNVAKNVAPNSDSSVWGTYGTPGARLVGDVDLATIESTIYKTSVVSTYGKYYIWTDSEIGQIPSDYSEVQDDARWKDIGDVYYEGNMYAGQWSASVTYIPISVVLYNEKLYMNVNSSNASGGSPPPQSIYTPDTPDGRWIEYELPGELSVRLNTLFDISREDPAVQRVLMLTRGMRLGGSAYSKVDRLFANGEIHVDPAKYGVHDKYFRAGLYLSYDGSKYRMVDKKDLRGNALNAAWLSSGYSGKFFKLLLCGQLLPESSITTVDVEASKGLGS